MSRHNDIASKIYVGELSRDTSERDLEKEFSYYGPLKSVWVARNPAGFAFVEFKEIRDAEDAVKGLDGRSVCGNRIRVEFSNGKQRVKPWQRGGDAARGPMRDDRCYECGERGHFARECNNRRNGNDNGYNGGRRGATGGGYADRRSRKVLNLPKQPTPLPLRLPLLLQCDA